MRFWTYIILITLYLVILLVERFLSSETTFLIKTLYLTFYLITEIIFLRMEDRKNWIINPVVLASVFTFTIGYGITNLRFIVPDSEARINLFFTFGKDSFNLLNSTMNFIVLGALCMWIGYRSAIGIFLFRLMTTKVLDLTKFIRKTFDFKIGLIYVFIFCSVLIRFYAIAIGIYGYAGTPEQTSKVYSITQYISLISLLSQYSLLVVSLSYFSSGEKVNHKFLFILLIIIEFFFGILSGFKSQMVVPFIIPLLAFLLIKKRIKKSLLGLSISAIIIAYVIVEPFRILRLLDPNFQSTPKYIIQTFYDAYILNKQVGLGGEKDAEFFLFAFLSRNNYMIEAAMAIDYENNVGLNEHDPDFLERLYLAPLHAVVPRFIWAGKPIEDTGLWFTQRVLGYDLYSATGFTPFGFLYFAGGVAFIALFFFLFGIMQNALFRFAELGSGGIIIFLGLLSTVVLIDTSVNAIFVTWIRFYPMLIILQYFTFKK